MTPAEAGVGADDLFRMAWLDDPRPDPDGRRIAWVHRWLDRAADAPLARVVVATAEGKALAEVALPGQSVHSPRWSPDGRLLAVVVDEPGAARLELVDLVTGRRRAVAAQESIADPQWSPDGRLIAYTAGRAEPVLDPDGWYRHSWGNRIDGVAGLCRVGRRVRVVDRSGTAADPGPGDPEARSPLWSPDGADLAFLVDGAAGPELAVQERLSGEIRTMRAGGAVRSFAWSPDGTAIAVIIAEPGLPDRNQQLRLIDPDTGSVTDLGRGLRLSVGTTVRGDDARGTGTPALCWSGHSGRIYAEVADGGHGSLAWFATNGKWGVLTGSGTFLSPAVAPDAPLLAAVRTTATCPGEVVLVDELTGRSTTVSRSNEWLRGRLAVPERLTVEHEGITVDAWVLRPPGTRTAEPVPLVTTIHGGPHYSVGDRFTFESHRLAGLGVSVLTLNPRGSQGYGADFATAIRGDWGGADARDVHAAIDAAIAVGGITVDRLAITGVSYGGFLTQWLLTGSDRFALGISENGISNIAAAWAGGSATPNSWDVAMAGPPWASEAYWGRSPLARADRIRTPLLLIHAADDQICPIDQSEQMLAALTRLGRPARLLRLAGEGHLINLLGRPSSRILRARAVDEALTRYLRPPEPAGRPLSS